MSIVTKTGDKGETSLFGGQRVPKNNLRVAAYGTVDELNSAIGVLAAELSDEGLKEELEAIQKACFVMGGELATPPKADEKFQSYIPRLKQADLDLIEQRIKERENTLPSQKKFILPGGARAATLSFWVRSVCRRAERAVVALAKRETVDPLVLQYLNRLSDYFFILARWLNKKASESEVMWEGGGSPTPPPTSPSAARPS